MCRSSITRRDAARKGPSKRKRWPSDRLAAGLFVVSAAEDIRYNERSSAERVNSALKDSCGGRFVRVRGALKVFCHLMFGILVQAVKH